MDYHRFEQVAREAFDAIPPQFREGVDGLELSRATVPHPSLPDVYTLGECKTEQFPTEFGGAGEVRSVVVLYYGSFLALSRLDDRWDWEGEIWETVTHEVRHHLESLASEDDLEELDYAEDQNFARREGEGFDPFFFRSGVPRAERVWEVDGDLFFEVEIGPRSADPVELRWNRRTFRVPLPSPLGDVHFVRLDGAAGGTPEGEAFAVLVRRAGWWESVRAALAPRPVEVVHSSVEV